MSSSTSSPPARAPAPVPASDFYSQSWKYDVFLSFRGEDTRKTFVDHLYSALDQQGINTYKDDITLPRGESIRPSLKKAVGEAQIAVIIFSKNYANSPWCLDELAHIMECKDMRGQTVIPIFYDVVPSALRKQKWKCKEALVKDKLENKKKAESWRKALVEASNISGWEAKHMANGHESKCIKEIVDTISHRLHPVTSSADENLIGVETRMRNFISCLQVGLVGVIMIGILGVGGGGKTTLASSIYGKVSCMFDGCGVVENIWNESSKNGLEKWQEKILSSVLKQKKVQVRRVEEGICVMMGSSCIKKVLSVLDGFDHLDPLNVLVGSQDWFGEGRRIITSRDGHRIILIDNDDAIEVFCMHGLNPVEKCLLVRDEGAMVLVAIWVFHRVRGINMWIQKALIIIWDGKFDMHELTQFMGHYGVRGEHSNNHENCCRVWKKEGVVNICATDAKVCANMKNRRWIDFKFKQRLEGTDPLPENFPIGELSCLTMSSLVQKELWEGYKVDVFDMLLPRTNNSLTLGDHVIISQGYNLTVNSDDNIDEDKRVIPLLNETWKNDRVERENLERLEKGENKVDRDVVDWMKVVQRERVETLEDRIGNKMEMVFQERMDRLENKLMDRMDNLETRMLEIEGSVVEQVERLTNNLEMEGGVVERMERMTNRMVGRMERLTNKIVKLERELDNKIRRC